MSRKPAHRLPSLDELSTGRARTVEAVPGQLALVEDDALVEELTEAMTMPLAVLEAKVTARSIAALEPPHPCQERSRGDQCIREVPAGAEAHDGPCVAVRAGLVHAWNLGVGPVRFQTS